MQQKLSWFSKRSRVLIALAIIMATLLVSVMVAPVQHSQAQSIVPVGSGSYTTAAPAGVTTPPSTIYRTANVTGPMPTSDWWTSVAWTQPAFPIYPLPLALQTSTTGIGVNYPDLETETTAVHAGYANDLTLGASTGTFSSPNPLVDGYSDWTVSMLWNNGSGSTMRVTAGQGIPYLYATYANENPQLTFPSVPTIWSGSATTSVLGITINAHNYALFGATGSTWSGIGTTTLVNNAGGKQYFSLAALPDNSAATLQAFQKYAYSFVTGTQVSWSYNQTNSQVGTTYTFTTQAKEGTQTGTIMALFPNQWKVANSFTPLSYTYHSIRGTMKTIAGSSFTTTLTYHGILPSFPDVGQYNQSTMIDDVEQATASSVSNTVGDTYWGGKALLQAANLIPLAKQTGLTSASNSLLAWLEGQLDDHFSATDASGNAKTTNLFYYDSDWGTLIGYPASYGSDSDLNDHHFHYGYWITAAAEVARADPAWVSKYGGMVNLLINDIADPSRTDAQFPFLRNFSPYEGHSWASGSELASWGNNQESSSEAINAWAGLIEWGTATGNTQIRDLGIYLYTTETQAVEQYWFNVDHDNFPAGYGYDYTAQVWGGQIWDGTYFSADPQDIRGINILPITSASMYLADNTSYEQEFLKAMATENGSSTWNTWQDTFWEYQAFIDAPGAIQLFNAQPNYTPGASESKAYTYSMLYDMQTLGVVDAAITANTPLYAVFNHSGTINHVASNVGTAAITVTFSDGTSFSVPAGQTAVNGKVVVARTLPPSTGLAINAGGGDDYPFVADMDFTGGATTSSNVAIDTSAASNPAPQYVYQSNRYGTFSYTIPNLTPNTAYQVRLHFAEIYWTQAGQRVFNVSANGTSVLSNFDIVTAAGAADKAVSKQVTATSNASGAITLQFTGVTDNAEVSGIEVLGASTGTPTPTPTPGSTPTPVVTPTPTPAGSGVQLNAGGSAAAPFAADADFTGGTTTTSTNTINTSGVTNPAPQAVYQSNRYGNFTYTIPNLTAGASYTVRLHFAETYWTQAGSRTFNVSINGASVLNAFDIVGTAGAANKATVQQFTSTADSTGKIAIQFVTVKDNAEVSGIEVLGSGTTTSGGSGPQINTGGAATAPFVADADFTGGTATTSTNTIDTSGVTNPAPQAVYQSNRYGNFSYAIPNLTANASYTVRLHFAETYWTQAGQRTFNVSINGASVLSAFDIVGATGTINKAVVKQFTATADSTGKITIQFTSVVDNAQVNGIEVLK